jgi:hypothetical protein
MLRRRPSRPLLLAATLVVGLGAPSLAAAAVVPTIQTPPAGGTKLTTPQFTWNDVGGIYEWRADGTDADYQQVATTSVEVQPPLGDGPHTLFVRNFDGTTYSAAATREIFVDTQVPTAPALTSPATGAPFADGAVPLAWTAASDPAPSSGLEYEVFVDDVPVGRVGGTSMTVPLSPDGTYTWKVTAVDGAGNRTTSGNRQVLIDTVPPTPATTLGPSGFVADATPTFTWSAGADATSGIAQQWVVVDGTAHAVGAGATSFTLPDGDALGQGVHTWLVRVQDAAGNPPTDSAPMGFTVDTEGPAITITQPTSGQDVQYGAAVNGVFDCDDGAGAGVATCLGPSDWVSPFPLRTTGIPLGPKVLTVNATDVLGNPASASVTFDLVDTVDPAAPPLLFPEDDAQTNDQTPTFSWQAADDLGGTAITEYRLEIDGEAPITIPVTDPGQPEYSYPYPSELAEDDYDWTVVAVDGGGNEAEAPKRTFSVDTKAPAAPDVTFPASPTNAQSHQIGLAGVPGASFNWKVTRADDSTQIVAQGSTPPGAVATTIGPLPEGRLRVSVTQTTPAGNTGDAAQSLLEVDLTAPAAPTLTATPPVSSEGTTPAFAWTGSGQPGSFAWQLLGGAGTQSGTTTEANLTLGPLAPGAYAFQVRETDAVGNTGAAAGFPFNVLPPPDPPGGGSTPAPAPSGATSTSTDGADAGPAKPSPTKTPAKVKPATANVARLTPRVGTVLRTVRPTLRWKRNAKATLYNVQVFRMQGSRFVKVHSSFPKTNKLRLPKGRLARGQRYVWRVWPFTGRTSSKRPIGVSYFDVAPLPKTRVRLKAPRASTVRTRRALAVRWTKSADARRYTVDVRRGKTTVFRRTTARTRLTIPGAKLRKAGTYRIRVRITASKTETATAATWALGSVKARKR